MEGVYKHYIIDLSSNNNFVQIPSVQGDGNNVRGFEVELISNNTPYIIDGDDTVISIMGTKPDTHQICNDCELTEEGYILVDITSQMTAVPGRGDYQIVLISKSTNSQLKSFPFIILNTKAVFDANYITSTDEFQLLAKNIGKVEAVCKNAETAVDDIRNLEESITIAESLRAEEENKRISSENNRVTAENLRQANTATAIANAEKAASDAIAQTNVMIALESSIESAEADRVTAENLRQQNTATAIANAEKAASDAITATSNANTATANANNKIAEIQNRINEYDSLDLANVTNNAIMATANANSATFNANTAAANAEIATQDAEQAANNAIQATEEARAAIEDIQTTLGIDDTNESLVSVWSSKYTHEVIIQEIDSQVLPIADSEVDALFV